jgi:hypothetical protein
MKSKLEKIEEATEEVTNSAIDNIGKFEQKLNELNADTTQNKIIIWGVAFIIAVIIILAKS